MQDGFYGDGRNCRECPTGAICPGTLVIAPSLAELLSSGFVDIRTESRPPLDERTISPRLFVSRRIPHVATARILERGRGV